MSKTSLPPHHLEVLQRFVLTCQVDGRVLAAFLGGSYARGIADQFSDLDLYVIVSDDAYDGFLARKNGFLYLLGEPLFIDDFDIPDTIFFLFANGTEGEMGIGSESNFDRIHSGPFSVLVDKKNLLRGVDFPPAAADPGEQAEKLRRLVFGFWHDLSHFITAFGRGQLWWAQGQLEELRRSCVILARLKKDFLDPEIGDEPYFKIEKTIGVEELSSLRDTFCPVERGALLDSAIRIVRFYRELAQPLAQAHDITYPEALDRMMFLRLEELGKAE